MTGKRTNSPFRKILVGYDGSPTAQKALDIAFVMARSEDSKVQDYRDVRDAFDRIL